MQSPLRSSSLSQSWVVATLFVITAAIPAAGAERAVPPGTSPAAAQVRVENAARNHLLAQAARAALVDAQVRVEVLPPRAGPLPCPGEMTVEALDTRNPMRMRFVAMCSSSPQQRTEFVARGVISASVVVASADITANRPISSGQLARERREISPAVEAASDIESIVGRSSRRPIRAGQVVSTRWLADPVLVKRGAAVSIVARNAGVEVRVAGEALEAGRRDEIVRVRNAANGKVITARVVDESTVEPAGNAAP